MVRSATLNDLPALAELFDAYRIFYEKQTDIDGVFHFLQDRMQNKESVIFVSEAEGHLTGFTQLYPLFSSTRMKRLWLLNDLFVSPEWRGKGHSMALIDAAKELAIQTNAVGLMLETAKSNFIGNQLYPKTGFVCDEDHNYYSWDVT